MSTEILLMTFSTISLSQDHPDLIGLWKNSYRSGISVFSRIPAQRWAQASWVSWAGFTPPGQQKGMLKTIPFVIAPLRPPLKSSTKQVFTSGTELIFFSMLSTCSYRWKKKTLLLHKRCNLQLSCNSWQILSLLLHFLAYQDFSIPWRLFAFCWQPAWGSYLSKAILSPSSVCSSGWLGMGISFWYENLGLQTSSSPCQVHTPELLSPGDFLPHPQWRIFHL